MMNSPEAGFGPGSTPTQNLIKIHLQLFYIYIQTNTQANEDDHITSTGEEKRGRSWTLTPWWWSTSCLMWSVLRGVGKVTACWPSLAWSTRVSWCSDIGPAEGRLPHRSPCAVGDRRSEADRKRQSKRSAQTPTNQQIVVGNWGELHLIVPHLILPRLSASGSNKFAGNRGRVGEGENAALAYCTWGERHYAADLKAWWFMAESPARWGSGRGRCTAGLH